MAENIYKERIEKYIDEHREDMLEDIKRLVRINSEKGEEKSGMPFGEGPYKALCEAEDIMRGYGFKVTNYDNYVTTADICDKERCLDILAHLDVVPAGEGWQITTPYEPVVKNGRIYGRGTADDKGPFIAALYAMRAIKELNVPISKNVRLIGGTDEECGSSDIAYYYKKEQEAPMTFSPDGEFPVVNIEKGSLRGHFYADYTVDTDKKIVDFTAGTKVNVVPGKAYATVSGISIQEIEQAAKAAAKVTFVDYICEEKDNGVYITAVGKGAHASTPKEGNNAITALLFLLTTLPFEDNEQIRLVKRLYAMMPHNDSNGIALNVAMSDELSGELTLAFSLLTIREGRIDGTFDSRCPICANEDNVLKVIKDRMAQEGFVFDTDTMRAPHHVSGDSAFVKTLLDKYEEVTGLKGECVSMGGGTYVHNLKNGVAFGASMPGTDNKMHGPDEFAVIEELTDSAKIFALAIAELCR